MRLFKKDPLQIIAFQGYGNAEKFYSRGRALEDENIDLSKRSFFTLLKNTWKRFETDEIPNAKLKITLPNDTVLYTTTDASGYFKIKEPMVGLNHLANDEGWLHYTLSFENKKPGWFIKNDNIFKGELLMPSQNSSFGVISDIDDTIIHTGVTSTLKWRLILNTLFKSVESRSPLQGAAQFYHLLHRGASGTEANPIFYVSHSPWHLYRYLEFFLEKNKFPKGPILLRNLREFGKKLKEGEKVPKQKEIINILNTYPQKRFILIGDSGEHDADIYIDVAKTYPNRIKAIYLRSVQHKKKMKRVQGLFDSYKETPCLLVNSSDEAIEHARTIGLIK